MQVRGTTFVEGFEPLSRVFENVAGQLLWLGGHSGIGDMGVAWTMPRNSCALLVGTDR